MRIHSLLLCFSVLTFIFLCVHSRPLSRVSKRLTFKTDPDTDSSGQGYGDSNNDNGDWVDGEEEDVEERGNREDTPVASAAEGDGEDEVDDDDEVAEVEDDDAVAEGEGTAAAEEDDVVAWS